MSSKLIRKSKTLVSAVAFSAFLLTAGLLKAAPPQPDFNISTIGEECMHPDRMAPAHAPVFASRGAEDDPLAALKKQKEDALIQLKKIASVDEAGHLRAGLKIREGQESSFIELSQQYGSLCIALSYAQEMEKLKVETLSESEKISHLLQNGHRYLHFLHTLSTTLPGLYDLTGWGQKFNDWELQNGDWTLIGDKNFLLLIGGKKHQKPFFSLNFLKKEMEAPKPQHAAAQDPQYMRSPERMLNSIYAILEVMSFDHAQRALDDMGAWMSDFKDFTETTRYDLRALKSEKTKLERDNKAFMQRLETFKRGERLEEVDGAMVPYFKYLGLIPTSTEFLKVEPANVDAVESLMKESFVLKSQALRSKIQAKERDFTLYEKITNYILDIEDYLSKHGRLS